MNSVALLGQYPFRLSSTFCCAIHSARPQRRTLKGRGGQNKYLSSHQTQSSG